MILTEAAAGSAGELEGVVPLPPGLLECFEKACSFGDRGIVREGLGDVAGRLGGLADSVEVILPQLPKRIAAKQAVPVKDGFPGAEQIPGGEGQHPSRRKRLHQRLGGFGCLGLAMLQEVSQGGHGLIPLFAHAVA